MLTSLREIWQAGGWVLGTIVAASTFAWVLIIRKFLEFVQARRALTEQEAALDTAETMSLELSLAQLLASMKDRGRRTARKLLAPIVDAERAQLERHLGSIAALATALPLLGLLGTVLGMVTTFEVITVHGTGEPRLMAHGIRQALVTTEAGLLAALPILLAHQFLLSRATRIENELRLLIERRGLEGE